MYKKLNAALLSTAMALALTACASSEPPIVSTSAVTVLPSAELPPPTSAVIGEAYRIGAYDRLIIDVLSFPELSNRRLQVDSAGHIALPLVGGVRVEGMSPAEVTVEIVRRLRAAHVRNPQVSVNVEESLSKFVTVDGQVVQPGNYPVVGKMTLLRAIAASRGVSEYARLEDVVIFRTVDGQRLAGLYNLGAIRRGVYPDPDVYPQDVVVVGDSPQRRLFRDFIATTPLLAAPIVAILNQL
jgi:polysaccharide export outer membrane protein